MTFTPTPTLPTAEHAALQLRREVADAIGTVRAAVATCLLLGEPGRAAADALREALAALEAVRPGVDRIAGEAWARLTD